MFTHLYIISLSLSLSLSQTHTLTRTSAVSRDGTARLWDCGSAKCLDVLTTIQQPIHSCSITASELVAQRNPTPPIGRVQMIYYLFE